MVATRLQSRDREGVGFAQSLADRLRGLTAALAAFTLYFELDAVGSHGSSVLHGHLISVELADHVE